VAIVAVGRNGIGLGHIARVIAACEAMCKAGLKPLLFADQIASRVIPRNIPTVLIPKMGELDSEDLAELENRVGAAALISSPSVVIEDTHPMGFELDRRIERILIVRPLVFSALMELKQGYESHYDRFFFADHPDSPTWPYSRDESHEIAKWERWSCIGPIYRSAPRDQIAEVRRRYSWASSRRICVFSLGGGGEHHGADDASAFLLQAEAIARRIRTCDPRSQLVFVKGPLFACHREIEGIFQTVDIEPLMPALFAISDLACIRPGFNSTWECISGGTPIVPILGTSYKEPITERLHRLAQFGLLAQDIESEWIAGKQANTCARQCSELIAKWPGDRVTDMVGSRRSERSNDSESRSSTTDALRIFVCVGRDGTTEQSALWIPDLVRCLLHEGFQVAVNVAISEESDHPRQLEGIADVSLYDFESSESISMCEMLDQFDPSVIVGFCMSIESVRQVQALGGFRLVLLAHRTAGPDSSFVFERVRQASGAESDSPDSPEKTPISKNLLGVFPLKQEVQGPKAERVPNWPPISDIRMFTNATERVAEACRGISITKRFFIRIDDVLEIDDGLRNVLELLGVHKAIASLDVIPYLCTFEASDLDALGFRPELLEIGQHGYCHLQRGSFHANKSEFDLESEAPFESDLDDLSYGMGTLNQRFASYFKGGFSPPFDGMPIWLGEAWEQLGGKFLSVMRNLPRSGRIPVVKASVETWNWQQGSRRSEAGIWQDICSSVVRIGYAGLVLHKQHLQTSKDLEWLGRMVSRLSEAGFVSIPMSTIALTQAENVKTGAGRVYRSLPHGNLSFENAHHEINS
jgi:hypothetical protein